MLCMGFLVTELVQVERDPHLQSPHLVAQVPILEDRQRESKRPLKNGEETFAFEFTIASTVPKTEYILHKCGWSKAIFVMTN